MYNNDRIGELDTESLNRARAEGKKIGLVQGSWDQFHIGHLKYIKKAKENCDYLIVAIDSDAKIQARKGKNRPLIPENERYEMIKELGVAKTNCYEYGKSLADDLVIKSVDEEKWGLIKQVHPDVLITITENYTREEYNELTKICESVLILPRQAETSTSAKLRKTLIANMSDKVDNFKKMFDGSVKDTRERLRKYTVNNEPFDSMMEHLDDSTDWISPIVAATKINNKWYYGTNQCDPTISRYDLNNRTELFYSTVEHAEINLLKRVSEIGQFDTIYVSLFPCDRCMKVLISKGIKKVIYLEDHLDKNWSKRSHELAKKNGIELICLLDNQKEEEIDCSKYNFIYPPNAREQEQLDIMIEREKKGIDPLDPDVINQEILFTGEYWYVSENRFPYDGVEHQFLIAAKNHVYKIEDMSLEMWNELYVIWKTLVCEYGMPGGAFCFRYGEPSKSGATLRRLHAHLIMPKDEEKTKFSIGGHKTLKRGLVIKE